MHLNTLPSGIDVMAFCLPLTEICGGGIIISLYRARGLPFLVSAPRFLLNGGDSMPAISEYRHVIWDFNGTILDDVGICIESVNIMLAKRNLPLICDEEHYRKIFRFPVIDYYRDVGFDFSSETYTDLAHEWMSLYRSREAQAPLRSGVYDILCAIRSLGIPQSIISATESGMLKEQLSSLGILEFFFSVNGREDIYAPDKNSVAGSWAERHGADGVIMIGDTDHDAECARSAGFVPALVAGGHQSFARLRSVCDLVYADFGEFAEAMLK